MYPQSHTIINGLDQMLHHHHHFPSNNSHHHIPMERSTSSWRPSIEVAPNCPRCASTNTKFCYYNNYSLSQPRYFCKGCRRYWTKGGSLRNVPVGGGCRKNRRGKASKNHQNDRVSINTSVSEDRESSIGENRQSNGSRDIDMALVFAKFLNQKPNTGEEFENGSSSCNNYLTPQESVETENHNDKGLLSDSDPNSLLTIENFGIEELEGFLWSDDAATMSSSVTWQQPPLMQMQLQELEYSVPLNENDQLLPISSESDMNSISDGWSNWSSFDLSTMQVFSSTL